MSDIREIKGAALEEVVRQMPAAAFIVEVPSGKIVINERAQQMIEQVLGQPMPPEVTNFRDLQDRVSFEVLRPDGRPYEIEEWPLMRSIRSGEEVRGEIVDIHADGTQLWLRCSSSPIYDEEGRIVAGAMIMHDITEQKRTEEELRQSEERFRATFEQAAVGIAHNALDGSWLRANQRLCDILGYTHEELLRKTLQDITYSDDLEADLGRLHQLLAGDIRTYSMEKRYFKRDNSIVWVNLTVSLVREPLGKPGYLITVIEDIDDRKRAEEALRESSRRTENILESITDAFYALDREWCFTYINERALGTMREIREDDRLMREELLGKSVWEMFPEAVGTTFYDKFNEALREQKTVEFEEQYPAIGVCFEVHVYPSEEGLSLYFRDITERKRVEKELETRTHQQAVVAELSLWALANNSLQSLMDDAVALVAQTLQLEYCKIAELLPSGEQLLLRAGVGWREGFIGNATEGAGPDSQSGYTLLSQGPVIVEDLPAETRFSPSWLLQEHGVVSGMTVVIPGRGGPFGALGVHTQSHRTFSEDDVNFLQTAANVLAMRIERKETDKQLEEVREAERSRIARDLHDEALHALGYALTEAREARSSISKDSSRQSNRLGDNRLGRLIAALKRVGQQLRGAIYDLRLGEEQDKPFHELLQTLVELHQTMAPECEIRLEVQDGALSGPLGERGRELLRIVGEALTNARRHSGAQNVRVAVVWSSEDKKLWAEVEDDGRGFDSAEGLPVTATGGMGMRGMRERARLLGGDLKIESEPEKGTKVRFELALENESEEPEGEEEKIRILLVEDHATLREAIASAFEREAGFEAVGQAGSLAEARRILGAEPVVDLVVVDLGLPDGYGGDLIKELRATDPRAQALVLSSSIDRSEIARAVEAGASGILSKTAHLGEVVEAIKRLWAGETLLPLEEVVEMLRFASSRREEEYEARQAIARLTPREREVLQALAEGLDSQQIAGRLHISLRTERNHMASILAKLGVHSQLQALVFAVRHGVVEIP